ncbi:peptide chain release factor N(5)-glutamine methyltransferase [bacterium]|nr:peptide chain release factor N(5)-glutamine methyltransferase [bacterium]
MNTSESKVGPLIDEAEKKLKNISATPRLDAEILLAKSLGTNRFGLFTKYNEEAGKEAAELFASFLERRINFEPVAYITNEKEFFEDTFFVDNRVLIPRPESEFIVEKAAALLKNTEKSDVLDICCGSGCIGLSVKRASGCRLTLSDISADAVEVAKINAARLFPGSTDISFVQSDLFGTISGKFDIITANPPYLSENDMKNFVVKELGFEPENAFFGGRTGFEITGKILGSVHSFLKTGGYFITELGFEGSDFINKNYENLELTEIIKDYSGINRAAVFRKTL